MENKKLVKILTKDMAELEELIAEMKTKQHYDLLEMEFVHSRVKGVLHLLKLLDASEGPVVPDSGEGNKILKNLKEKVEKVSKLTSEFDRDGTSPETGRKAQEEEPFPGVVPEPPDEEEEQGHPEESPLPGVIPEPPKQELEEGGKNKNVREQVPNNKSYEEEVVLQEDTEIPEVASRLGDSFLKGRSVNDLITDQVKRDYKLSNRPVANIQAAIGINDRFQFIRELFDGDNRKYIETVKTLDSMDNIKHATDYLRANFKWKKNETSLKFVNLVKRRFQGTSPNGSVE